MPHLDKSHEKYKKYIYSYLYDLEYMKRFEKKITLWYTQTDGVYQTSNSLLDQNIKQP
jgi:hypothetical protein